jgi:acyl phosphate:glycerol-3-phosphate acyltransferase
MVPYYIIMGIIAYLIGSINFSILISKKIAGFDVREKGSGNAGTTNMLRTVGKGAAVLTLILDILKGVLTIFSTFFYRWLCLKIGHVELDESILAQISGIMVILGHTYPIYFGFKGGKGVATALGILLTTNYQIGLICLVFALVLIILTRMVSVGSLGAAILFPVLTLFLKENYIAPGNYLIYSIIIALIIMFNHRTNIKRLFAGTENKISFGKIKQK